jgi:hypothetical protein
MHTKRKLLLASVAAMSLMATSVKSNANCDARSMNNGTWDFYFPMNSSTTIYCSANSTNGNIIGTCNGGAASIGPFKEKLKITQSCSVTGELSYFYADGLPFFAFNVQKATLVVDNTYLYGLYGSDPSYGFPITAIKY